jgi:hypothetical protein
LRIGFEASSIPRVGDRADERGLGLPGGQPGVLDDDRHVRLDLGIGSGSSSALKRTCFVRRAGTVIRDGQRRFVSQRRMLEPVERAFAGERRTIPDGLAASEPYSTGGALGPAKLAIVTGCTLLPRRCIKAISRGDASFTKRMPEVAAACR